MKAQLGETEYYILSMKAEELISKVKILKELKEWGELTIEERYQREINYARVKAQITPYLAKNNMRFFGAIIVAAFNFDPDANGYEPLSDLAKKGLPRLYQTTASSMGFLTFQGGEILVPLDGQHRLKAIEFAITGKDHTGKPISDIAPCINLANEDVTVILVPCEKDNYKKARSIFMHVNLYAKKPQTAEILVTNDDDVCAVLAREIANEKFGGRLVKFKGSTLNKTDGEFTTLSTIYNCIVEIIKALHPNGTIDKTRRPAEDVEVLYRGEVNEIWDVLLENIEVFSLGISSKDEEGDEKRREIRERNLLGKPVGQECLVRAFLRLTDKPDGMTSREACERLNLIPWVINEENVSKTWQNVLWQGPADKGNIITKKRDIAGRLAAYLAGEKLTAETKSSLDGDYQELFPDSEGRELPNPVK